MGVRLGCPLLKFGAPPQRVLVAISFVCIIGAALLVSFDNHVDPRSPADQASLPTYVDEPLRTHQTAENWQSVCQWIRQNTPSGSLFLTPHRQQTFKWYAERAEVACWKDAPQDAAGLIRWYRRIEQLRLIEDNDPRGIFVLQPQQVDALIESHGVTHFLIPQACEDAALASPLGPTPFSERWKRCYPEARQ